MVAQPVMDIGALEYILYDSAIDYVERYRAKDKPWLRGGPQHVRRPRQERLF